MKCSLKYVSVFVQVEGLFLYVFCCFYRGKKNLKENILIFFLAQFAGAH